MDHYLTALVLIVTIHGACSYLNVHTSAPLSREAARQKCRERGGTLALPRNQTTNDDITRHLVDNNITLSWIGVQIIPSYWHRAADSEPIYDQGCYGLRDVEYGRDRRSSVVTSSEDCVTYCTRHDYDFATIQRRSARQVNCNCAHQMKVTSQLDENQCRTRCWGVGSRCGSLATNTTRVLATGGRGNTSRPWGTTFTPGALCALDYNSQLSRYSCSRQRYFRCSSDRDVGTSVTWFEGASNCHEKGGRLSGGWADVKAWRWQSETGSGDIYYTSWAPHHPDFSAGTCVTISADGSWRTADCSMTHYGVCSITPRARSPAATPGLAGTDKGNVNDGEETMSSSNHDNVNKTGTDVTTVAVGVAVGMMVIAGLVAGAVIYSRRKPWYKRKRPVLTYRENPRYSKNDIHVVCTSAHGVTNKTYDIIPADVTGGHAPVIIHDESHVRETHETIAMVTAQGRSDVTVCCYENLPNRAGNRPQVDFNTYQDIPFDSTERQTIVAEQSRDDAGDGTYVAYDRVDRSGDVDCTTASGDVDCTIASGDVGCTTASGDVGCTTASGDDKMAEVTSEVGEVSAVYALPLPKNKRLMTSAHGGLTSASGEESPPASAVCEAARDADADHVYAMPVPKHRRRAEIRVISSIVASDGQASNDEQTSINNEAMPIPKPRRN